MRFKVKTKGFCDIIDITSQVKETLKKSKVNQGVAFIFVLTTTVGLTIMEYEPNTVKDLQNFFEKITPQKAELRRLRAGKNQNYPSSVAVATAEDGQFKI